MYPGLESETAARELLMKSMPLSRWDSPSHTSCMHASRHQSDTTDNNYISGPEEAQVSFRFIAVCRLNFPAVALAKASFVGFLPRRRECQSCQRMADVIPPFNHSDAVKSACSSRHRRAVERRS